MASIRQRESSRATRRTTTHTVTINAAFLQEIKEVHVELWNALDQIRAFATCPDWNDLACQRLVKSLESFRDLLNLCFRLEDDYGYFDDPVYVDARFSNRVGRLRAEHQTLYAEITRIGQHAERLLYNGRLSESVQGILSRLAAFFDQLEQHETREKELITEAFTHEVGCGD
ncbi:MAG: hypothetical protein JJ992_29080 [Planctomycetes bacterium]|nr:hypothetical protein [Planctomycetota bacterium]